MFFLTALSRAAAVYLPTKRRPQATGAGRFDCDSAPYPSRCRSSIGSASSDPQTYASVRFPWRYRRTRLTTDQGAILHCGSLAYSLALPTTWNDVSGGTPSRRIRAKVKLLAGGGFALEEKRLRFGPLRSTRNLVPAVWGLWWKPASTLWSCFSISLDREHFVIYEDNVREL